MKQKIIEVLRNNCMLGTDTGFDDLAAEIVNAIIITVDKDNLPNEKVIAFDSKGIAMVGTLKPSIRGGIFCELPTFIFHNIIHYMEIPVVK